MLQSITLKRYRAFEDVTVQLGPLTAFVGANASGKSSLLRACVEGSFGPRDVRGMTGRASAERQAIGEPRQARSWDSTISVQLPPLGQLLHLDVTEMRRASDVQEAPTLAATGGNLANVVGTMPRRRREELAQHYCRLVPVFGDVDVRPASRGQHRVVFQDRWSPSVWYEPSEVSDGSLFALALMSIRYQLAPPSVVALEEPEHGLHPYLLSEIVELLRALATDPKSPIQVLLATQSSELLDLLRPEEVRFLTRKADGSVDVRAADVGSDTWKEAYDAHQSSLASLWLSGTSGGVP